MEVLGLVEGADEGLEFGEVVAVVELFLLALGLGGVWFEEDVAALCEGGAEGGVVQAVLLDGGEQHAAEAWV